MKRFIAVCLVIGSMAVATSCVGVDAGVDWIVRHEQRIGELERQVAEIVKDADEIKDKGVGSLSAKDALDVEKLIEDIEKLKEAHPEVK